MSQAEAFMSDQSQVKSHRETSWPLIVQNMPPAVQVHMDAWFHEQAGLFDEMQKMMGAWMKRRQEAMEAAFRTFQRASNCKDAGALAACYGEWLTGNVNRIIADLDDARDEALRMGEIGQKSAAALWQQGAREKAPAAAAAPVAAERGTRRAKDLPPSESVQEPGERSAAE
jgi:hypothetical protein